MPYLTQEEYDELEAEAANAAALTARVKELEEAPSEISRKIIQETIKLGDLTDREVIILETGFSILLHKLAALKGKS